MKTLFLWMCIPLLTGIAPGLATAPTYKCPPCNGGCDDHAYERPGSCSHCGMELILQEPAKNNAMRKEQAQQDSTRREKSQVKASGRKKIAFYLQNGVEVLDFAGPMEVFAYAGYEVFTVSKTKAPIVSQGILKVNPDYDIHDAPQADILAFFGGNANAATQDTEVIDWVKSHTKVEQYFSVCTGAFILAEAGLLKGKTATTFHDALDHFEKTYADTKVLRNVRFVDNGNVITTAGISAGIDGALHLVTKLQGLDAARRAAYYMEYDKWIPGEGLILSDNNPYQDTPGKAALQPYTGLFESPEGTEVRFGISERDKGLYAAFEERNYPLFSQGGGRFSTPVGKGIITFVRDSHDKVTGYTLSPGDKLYRKIK